MTTALAPATRQRPLFEPQRRGRLGARPAARSGPTLEERLNAAWEELEAVGAAECPVCGDRLEREGDSGLCGGCGSVLS